MQITAKRLTNPDLIKKFLTQDELWDRISENNQSKEDFIIPIADMLHWVGIFEGTRLFGIIVIHQTNTISAVAHINIQKQDRYKLSKKAGIVGLQYIIDETEYMKINTEIAVIYPAVIEYVKWLGFECEGNNRKSINKNNVIINQLMFGITRDEIMYKLERGV